MPEIIGAGNSQTMNLLGGYLNINPTGVGGAEIAIVDSVALDSNGRESEFFVDLGKSGTGQISVYTVRHGDTLSEIAEMFGVSTNTILWANDIKSGFIKEGQELVILPISGVRHIVKSGDNLWVIAHRFGDTETQLEQWNHINLNTPLRIGEQLQVSNKIVTPPAKKKITSITHVVATAKKKITTVAHITHVVPVKHIVFSKQTKKTIASNEHLYIVKPGDNLHQLAAEFNTTTYYIIEHNHLKTTDLSIGEHLELPNA